MNVTFLCKQGKRIGGRVQLVRPGTDVRLGRLTEVTGNVDRDLSDVTAGPLAVILSQSFVCGFLKSKM